MKKILFIILAGAFLLSSLPSFAVTAEGRVTLDFDGSFGYRGTYVLAYNPNESGGGKRTGDITELIDSSLDDSFAIKNSSNTDAELLSTFFLPEPLHTDVELHKDTHYNADNDIFEVGYIKEFEIYEYYSGEYIFMDMTLKAVGKHCYVWEAFDPERYPLSDIVPQGPMVMADEFDSKYDLMVESFGNFYDPQGHGRLNLLFYDIHDGWTPDSVSGNIGGFFDAVDMQNSNRCATVHLDTYPTIYNDTSGSPQINFNKEYCGGIIMHEFQHCINYSNCGYTSSWINECMSAAAEEITYPGSSIVGRILQWENGEYDWLTNEYGEYVLATKREFEATSDTQTGSTLYAMPGEAETGYAYAQVSLLAQYLYSQNDNSVFKRMTDAMANGASAKNAIPMSVSEDSPLYGLSMSEIGLYFRIACVTNDFLSYGGSTGFVAQDGFDSVLYYNLETPYSLLSPSVYISGGTVSIKPGGFVLFKPKNGVYFPPQNASEDLVYVGITITDPEAHDMGDVNLDGLRDTGDAALMLMGIAGKIELSYSQLGFFDINHDGDMTTGDASYLLKCISLEIPWN